MSEGGLVGLTFAAPPIAGRRVALGAGAGEGAEAVLALFAWLTGLQAGDGGQRTLVYVCRQMETSPWVLVVHESSAAAVTKETRSLSTLLFSPIIKEV